MRAGFTHWYPTADGERIGFNKRIDPPAGLMFAVPAMANYELEEARSRMVDSRGTVGDPMDIGA